MQTGHAVITKYGVVFDLMNINELRLSVAATVGRRLSYRAGADQLLTSDVNLLTSDVNLLTSDVNPSVVTSTFDYNHHKLFYRKRIVSKIKQEEYPYKCDD